MTLAAGTPIGKYVVKHKLAEGGMAEIYLATARGPEGFEKEVVIKRVRSFLADDEGFVRMFIAEARLVSRLNHANVVQIFDFDKHEDSYYLAMEYVRGCSLWELRKRCRERGLTPPAVLVAHLGAQVAAGLSYAHRARGPDGEPLHLVHRDVTPQNVLVSLDGAVKLTDFGIAKAGDKLTQPGVLKGKFAYMSPEQARGERVDARTDVFALGVVLWEMLTGGRLFDGDSELAVLRAVQESVITPPARLNPDVPASLDAVITTALQRDPAARYQSAAELERALAQCVLRLATSVDDTDVGAFVRRVLDTPLVPSAPAAREATAVKPGLPPSPRVTATRASPPEDSLVLASTLVLSRDMRGGGAPTSTPPETGETAPGAAPPPVAPVLPPAPVVPAPPASGRTRGPWVGVGVAALVLVGGVAAWRSLRPAAPSAPVAAREAPGTASPAPVTPEPVPAPPPSTPPVALAGDAGVALADAGAVAAQAPVPPPAEPVVAAKGTLSLKAVPYAAVYLNDQLLTPELSGTREFPVEPGSYTVTFKHRSRTQTCKVTIASRAQKRCEFQMPRTPSPAPPASPAP